MKFLFLKNENRKISTHFPETAEEEEADRIRFCEKYYLYNLCMIVWDKEVRKNDNKKRN